jgi:lipopolysaccharide export system permease protein
MSFVCPSNPLVSGITKQADCPGCRVSQFDRYFLSQMMMSFGLFSLVLVMVYWVNRAVVLFDRLIANGHSAVVFLEFSALTLPGVIRLVLPIAAFAAAVSCTNRLSSDSELVVVQATGFSPFRLARPVLVFGLIVAALLSVLNHVLVPASLVQLAERQKELDTSITTRLLQEGTFFHPARGVTFYIREISPQGEMTDIFLSDRRPESRQIIYTARSAFLVRSPSGPKLVMADGMAQDIRSADQRLSTTSFSEFVFDIGALLETAKLSKRRANQIPTWLLLAPNQDVIDETGDSRARLLQRGHARISQAFLAVVTALVGFSALLIGGFNRFGLWRQILAAVVILIVLASLDNFMNDFARRNEAYWPLVYLATLVGLATTGALLWLSARPAIVSRRRQRTAP